MDETSARWPSSICTELDHLSDVDRLRLKKDAGVRRWIRRPAGNEGVLEDAHHLGQ